MLSKCTYTFIIYLLLPSVTRFALIIALVHLLPMFLLLLRSPLPHRLRWMTCASPTFYLFLSGSTAVLRIDASTPETKKPDSKHLIDEDVDMYVPCDFTSLPSLILTFRASSPPVRDLRKRRARAPKAVINDDLPGDSVEM